MKRPTTPIKVLFVETGSGNAGSTNSLGRILSNVPEGAIEAHVICYGSGSKTGLLQERAASFSSLELWENGPPEFLKRVCGITLPTGAFLRSFSAISKAIVRIRPDVVYLNNTIDSHIPGILAARLFSRRTVCHLRDCVVLTRTERMLAKLVDRLVALNDAERDLYIGQGIPADRIRRVHNAVDLALFAKNVQKETITLSGAPRIGSVGSLEGRKGHVHVIRAFRQVVDRFPEARLYIAGTGPMEQALRTEVERLALDHHVVFLGYFKSIPELMRKIDVFTLATNREGVPYNVLLEAMAAGTPAVVTDLPGIREVLQNGETGFIVPVGDEAALAGRLLDVLADGAKMASMGQGARRQVEALFNAQREAGEIIQVIQSAHGGA